MTSNLSRQKQDTLAYLALYYAILGDTRKSEQILRSARRMGRRVSHSVPKAEPVLVA